MLKRFLYLGYYLKELDREKFSAFLEFASKSTGKSKAHLISDCIVSSVRYNISFLEYFQFRFYEIPASVRKTFAGTGFMYEYQLRMNPKRSRKVLADKIEFLDKYKSFVRHKSLSLSALKNNSPNADELLHNRAGKIVLKSSDGQCGRGVVVKDANVFKNAQALIRGLEETNNDLAEEFVVQHPALMELSPSGLNTIRIVTQLDANNNVVILAARLRISINSAVDNLAAGNMAAPIDISTGKVVGPGVFSDIRKSDMAKHPVTGISVVGFQVPFWKETVDMIVEAAKTVIDNRSVGWDIAITENGPELIEGNHDWCKLVFQLPVKKGLKPMLEEYL